MDDLAPPTPLLKPSALYNIRHTAAEPAKPPWLCLPQRIGSRRSPGTRSTVATSLLGRRMLIMGTVIDRAANGHELDGQIDISDSQADREAGSIHEG